MKNTTESNNLYKVALTTLLSLSIFAITVLVNPNLKESVTAALNKKQRKILSAAQGKLFDGRNIKVVKVKTHEGLFVEVYDLSNENIHPLLDRIQLPDLKDGFILLQGTAINLALEDVDGDRAHEIIAPSIDKNLVAHLNVYSFNPDTNKFEFKNFKTQNP